MEDYIFLIIAVVISIFAAINKNKKSKIAENELETDEIKTRNYFMDQLLGEDFLEETIAEEPRPVKEKQAPVEIPVRKVSEIQRSQHVRQPFKSTLPERIKRQSLTSIKRQPEPEVVNEAEEESSSNYFDDFSLRKAVVYSIIMERKY
ncbi:MAG TPA: hypothetical protein DHV48_17070 [Prolixibacteraceae bacterium]|nr:hypothetical protein [Prolixibacteraceae bacterium]